MYKFFVWITVALFFSLTLKAQKEVSILPIGTSITYGIGSSDGNGYRKVLFEKLLSQGWKVKMLGSQQNGNFTQPWCEAYPGKVISFFYDSVISRSTQLKPDFILLEVGVNDMSYPVDPEHAILRMSNLVDKLTSTFPSANLVVGTVPPIWTNRTLDFNKDLAGLVNVKQAQGLKVYLCDLFQQGIGINEVPDAVHPNDAGFIKMANAWADAILSINKGDGLPFVVENLSTESGPDQNFLAWSSAFQATSYRVKRAVSPNGPFKEIAKVKKDLWFIDTSAKDQTTYYYVIAGVNEKGDGPDSKYQSATPMRSQAISINCGGPKSGGAYSDIGYEGGRISNWYWGKIDLQNVQNKNSVFVFKTGREGNFSYYVTKLNSSKYYHLKLHFVEGEFSQSGKRTFDVEINGVKKLANFDILEKAKGKNIAHTESFYLKPNEKGAIELKFISVIGTARLSGFEVTE